MSKPTLVIVLAGNCRACVMFKNERLPELNKWLSTYTKIDVIPVPTSIGEPLEKSSTPRAKELTALNKYIKSYPSFLLVPAGSLPTGNNVLIYGARFENGFLVSTTTQIPTVEDLKEWIINAVDGQTLSTSTTTSTVAASPPTTIKTEGSVKQCNYVKVGKKR